MHVRLEHRITLPGRREDKFDLYLPEVGLLIDLDPEYTHRQPEKYERDLRKTRAALATGLDIERVRESGLRAIPGIPPVVAGPVTDPVDWANSIIKILRRRGRLVDLIRRDDMEFIAAAMAGACQQSVLVPPPRGRCPQKGSTGALAWD